MWFKINFTLLKTGISHKWDNNNEFVLKHLETMIPWQDVVKTETGDLLGQTLKNKFTLWGC